MTTKDHRLKDLDSRSLALVVGVPNNVADLCGEHDVHVGSCTSAFIGTELDINPQIDLDCIWGDAPGRILEGYI